VGYNYNFNGMPTNTLRSFDGVSNSITLQNAEIVVSGEQEDFGYRVDVNYGFDAANIHSLVRTPPYAGGGLLSAQPLNQQIDLQQAFITMPCPWTGGTVTAGKFVTWHGAEVIEAKDNFNASRGFLFNYAIPFTHTGLKYDKGGLLGDTLSVGAGITNGWDNLQDNNKGKTFHGVVGFAPTGIISLTVSGAYGPEQTAPATPSIEKNSRALVDTVLKVAPSDDLTLLLNHDWGVEEGLVPAGTDTTQNWAGLAATVNYNWTDMFSTAVRWETFDDEGSRTGTEQVLNSATITLQHKKGDLIQRLEFRQDGSSDMVFVDDAGRPDDVQSTIGAQIIYSF
jgi:hypothetical protein